MTIKVGMMATENNTARV
jgi:hypothetical protein